jgi:hypothetical protein
MHACRKLPFFCFRYSSSASISSRSISDSQSSAQVEHSWLVARSSQRGAPQVSQCVTWSSEICFPQSVHLIILCSLLRTVSCSVYDCVFFEFEFFCHSVYGSNVHASFSARICLRISKAFSLSNESSNLPMCLQNRLLGSTLLQSAQSWRTIRSSRSMTMW